MHKCLDHVSRYCDMGQSEQGSQRSKTKSRGKEKTTELLPRALEAGEAVVSFCSHGVREFTDKEKFE